MKLKWMWDTVPLQKRSPHSVWTALGRYSWDTTQNSYSLTFLWVSFLNWRHQIHPVDIQCRSVSKNAEEKRLHNKNTKVQTISGFLSYICYSIARYLSANCTLVFYLRHTLPWVMMSSNMLLTWLCKDDYWTTNQQILSPFLKFFLSKSFLSSYFQ